MLSSGIDPVAAQHALLKSTLELLTHLKFRASNNKGLDRVSKSTRLGLVSILGEVLNEIQEQSNKIAGAIKVSKSCFVALQSVHDLLKEIQTFMDDCDKKSFVVFLNKASFKTHDKDLRSNLRAKTTQLTSSVTIAMLSQPKTTNSRVSSGIGLGNVIIDTVEAVNAAGSMNGKAFATAKAASSAGALQDNSLGLMYTAGYMFYHGIGRPRNFTLAHQKFLEAAEIGDSDSMSMVARCYLNGQGVEADMHSARMWLSKGAIAGSNRARTDLAVLLLAELPHSTALMVPKKLSNRANAESTSYSQGDEDNLLRLFHTNSIIDSSKEMTEGDEYDHALEEEKQQAIEWSVAQALRLLLDAASECYTEAQMQLASINEAAGNFADAIKWYQLAANDNCPLGMVGLGRMHLAGTGTSQNSGTALNLFLSAGRAGCPEGFYFAGVTCEMGIPASDSSAPSPNMLEATKFYQLGAEGGVREAMFAYGYTLLRECIGMSGSLDSADLPAQQRFVYDSKASDGIKYLRMASEMGVVDANFQLGRCYEQGIGVARDEQSAFGQFKIAAAKGHAKAALCAANLLFTGFHSGIPSAFEISRSFHYYIQAAALGDASAVNSLGLLVEDGRIDANSIANLYPLAGSMNISSADPDTESHRFVRLSQLKLAAMLFYHAISLENGDALLNLALLLSGSEVSSFVSHSSQLVTTQSCLTLLKSITFTGPARMQYQQLLEKIETVVCVLVQEKSRMEEEEWKRRFPSHEPVAGRPASPSSFLPQPTASRWRTIRNLVSPPKNVKPIKPIHTTNSIETDVNVKFDARSAPSKPSKDSIKSTQKAEPPIIPEQQLAPRESPKQRNEPPKPIKPKSLTVMQQ